MSNSLDVGFRLVGLPCAQQILGSFQQTRRPLIFGDGLAVTSRFLGGESAFRDWRIEDRPLNRIGWLDEHLDGGWFTRSERSCLPSFYQHPAGGIVQQLRGDLALEDRQAGGLRTAHGDEELGALDRGVSERRVYLELLGEAGDHVARAAGISEFAGQRRNLAVRGKHQGRLVVVAADGNGGVLVYAQQAFWWNDQRPPAVASSAQEIACAKRSVQTPHRLPLRLSLTAHLEDPLNGYHASHRRSAGFSLCGKACQRTKPARHRHQDANRA